MVHLSLWSNVDCQAEEVMGGSRSEEMLVLDKRERSDPVVDKVSGVLGNPAG